MSLNFTLLTEEQIWGDENGNGQLDAMKKYGIKVAPTDLTVLLGGYVTAWDDRTSEGDLTCSSWSVSSTENEGVRCVNYHGSGYRSNPRERVVSTRPALHPSDASKISPSETTTINGIRVVEYGEYPQTVADEQTSLKLEELFASDSLRTTGKNYTFDSVGLDGTDTSFKAIPYPEYELGGKRYILVPGRPADSDSYLSTGKKVKRGGSYWVQVQPIEWLVDKSGWMVSKKCLIAGIQFSTKYYYNGDFSKTFMKHYLDTYFAKEIEPYERPKEREKRVDRKESIKGLKAKLAEAIDPEKVEEKIGFTRTESRREIVKAIKTTRRARDVFIAAAKKAQKEGDQELIDKIVEMADFYVRSDQAQRRAARQRRAESRAQRATAKKNSER